MIIMVELINTIWRTTEALASISNIKKAQYIESDHRISITNLYKRAKMLAQLNLYSMTNKLSFVCDTNSK